ncbi:MAG: T9SS C-terminal target domain-containing protein [Rhodothermaeota bacterium MED-G64]|nr:MAG: T9SS C-terminal target domain-containing protein [Rhodothermaeota bacterium MED-G64]
MKEQLLLFLWFLVLNIVSLPVSLIGQNSPLFIALESQKITQTELQVDEIDRTYIRFYDGLFKSVQPFASELISFDLDGERREFTIMKRAEYYTGVFSVIAKELHTGSLFIATVQGNRFTAKIHDHRRDVTSHIRYNESIHEHYLTTLNVEALDILGCAIDDHNLREFHSETIVTKSEVMTSDFDTESNSFKTVNNSSSHTIDAISAISSLEDKTTIDILYVYTDAAQEFAEFCQFNGYSVCESVNTIEAYLAQMTILTQSAFDNSGIAIELRPVFNYKVDYDETSDGIGSGERLRRFTSSPTFNPSNWNAGGYMNDVHEIRDDVGADMVAGIFDLSDVGGIAWLTGSVTGFPEIAFSLNRIQQLLTGYTLAHELGHNMGLGHSRSQASNTAGLYGGLFHYSVGYQWVTENEAFVTVMGYGEFKQTLSGDTVRTQDAAVFSSPDVTWQGVAAGTLEPIYGPTNATKSNKEIKLTISDYRPTMVDAPEIAVDQEAVTISMNREDRFDVPLTISNTGLSNLMWRVATKSIEPPLSVESSDIPSYSPNLSLSSYKGIEQSDDRIVFSEDFEGFKSRLIGGYRARQGWRTQSIDNMFAIKTNNPSSGEKHFQVRASEEPSYYVQSPFFGPQLEGTFEVSFDISITNDRDTDGFNRVDLQFYDAVNDTRAAGVAINNDLEFQTYHRSEHGGSTVIMKTGEYFEPNTSDNDSYRTVRIKLNATTARIEYYLDDILVNESHYLNAGVIDVFYVTMNGGLHPLGLVDIDNIQVRRPNLFEWLDIDDVAGAVDPGQQGTLNLSFNTIGVSAGVYQTKLQLINNSQSSIVEIPVTLSVSTAVSNEEDPLRPSEFRLSPAYPNPFNPQTTLSFEIPEASVVSLEVFDILGRRVQTLTNEPFAAGTHAITLDATSLSSGLYMVRMQAGRFVATQHVTLIK